MNLGDKNTRYFHTQALIRRKRSQILKRKSDQGNWVENECLIQTIVSAFKNRFTASSPPSQNSLRDYTTIMQPCVTDTDNAKLLAPVSELELENFVRSIGALKAPSWPLWASCHVLSVVLGYH